MGRPSGVNLTSGSGAEVGARSAGEERGGSAGGASGDEAEVAGGYVDEDESEVRPCVLPSAAGADDGVGGGGGDAAGAGVRASASSGAGGYARNTNWHLLHWTGAPPAGMSL
jgi:hypothetical protein